MVLLNSVELDKPLLDGFKVHYLFQVRLAMDVEHNSVITLHRPIFLGFPHRPCTCSCSRALTAVDITATLAGRPLEAMLSQSASRENVLLCLEGVLVAKFIEISHQYQQNSHVDISHYCTCTGWSN